MTAFRDRVRGVAILLWILGCSSAANAADPASPNYSLLRGTPVAGGGAASSPGFSATTSVGTASTSQSATSPGYQTAEIFPALPDGDGDAVADNLDNCTVVSDASQRDTNSDGYGNRCDGDLNNDGMVNNLDLGLFKQRYGGTDPDADFNGDGSVNNLDLGLFKQMYGKPPGPSGIVP